MRRGAPLLLAVAVALAFVSAGPGDFPPIPPLPSSNWPSADAAEPFARALLARVPPAELANVLATKPDLVPGILRNLGTAVMTSDPSLRNALEAYLDNVARIAASTSSDVQRLTAIVAVDPLRYGTDRAFRARIDALLPHTFSVLPRSAARAVLNELTSAAALDFDTAEEAAAAARLVPRRSSKRRVAFPRTLQFPDDVSEPIDASIYSLGTSSFTPAEALRFLQAVHNASPLRRIVVLADSPMRDALAPEAQRLHLDLIDDLGRPFTPWPRDPFTVARGADGRVIFVNRPNPQPHREEDQNMVRSIVQSLPASVDHAWKRPGWTVAGVPFHNGQILRTPTAVWISIHTVEPRALAMLGLDHVPVETFGTPAGVKRYIEAARAAANELGELYHAPVRFVHALPPAADIARLGGGAGYDLDSILTILPHPGGKDDALVADLTLGAAAARNATAAEWSAAMRAYSVQADARTIADAQSKLPLQAFLDEVAAELRRDGMRVRRVPLLNVPGSPDFLLTVNNVVMEKRRAEGFATLLAPMDRAARDAFAASGYKLDLFPPLVRSVIRNGGYRCASNHVRRLSS